MLNLFSVLGMFSIFVLMCIFRKKLAAYIRKIKTPVFILYIITAAILIVFEEYVNCEPWCGTVLIPPTLPFLLIELLVVYAIFKLTHAKSVWMPVITYSIFGIFWETSIGVASLQLRQLFEQSHVGYFLLLVWVGISYAFVTVLPLTILQNDKTN